MRKACQRKACKPTPEGGENSAVFTGLAVAGRCWDRSNMGVAEKVARNRRPFRDSTECEIFSATQDARGSLEPLNWRE